MEREYFITEIDYEEQMINTVEPYLKEMKQEGSFESFDGLLLHYEAYILKKNVLGAVVICHGFTESAEKFREMAYYFFKMGYHVFALDQRGHGQSGRLNRDLQTVAVGKFEDYVQDLHLFIKGTVKKITGELPLYLYCHSMGGAVGIQYLQTHPGIFEKAVLSAPMVMCRCSGMKPMIALMITKLFCLLGKKNERVFVYSGFNPNRTYENSHDTSKARFDYYQAKRVKDPMLQTASASYNWVVEAIQVSKKNLNPKRCQNIKIPVLLCQPEEDSSVYSEKEDEFIKLIPNGRLVRFTKCKHEIYASVDETVKEYLTIIEQFMKNM